MLRYSDQQRGTYHDLGVKSLRDFLCYVARGGRVVFHRQVFTVLFQGPRGDDRRAETPRLVRFAEFPSSQLSQSYFVFWHGFSTGLAIPGTFIFQGCDAMAPNGSAATEPVSTGFGETKRSRLLHVIGCGIYGKTAYSIHKCAASTCPLEGDAQPIICHCEPWILPQNFGAPVLVESCN